jgi:hypothetical protein
MVQFSKSSVRTMVQNRTLTPLHVWDQLDHLICAWNPLFHNKDEMWQALQHQEKIYLLCSAT